MNPYTIVFHIIATYAAGGRFGATPADAIARLLNYQRIEQAQRDSDVAFLFAAQGVRAALVAALSEVVS